MSEARVQARVTAGGVVRSATFRPLARRAASATPSAHRAYVAMVSNQGPFGSTDATIQATIDAALNRWREESNGAITSFTRVDVKPLATTTDCTSGSDMYNEAATKLYPGVSTSSSSGNHVIVISPPGCAGGVGTVQGGMASGGRLNASWNPQATIQTLMHELGHNFSLRHANACYAPLGPSCVTKEYANTYALMGFTLSNDPAYTPAALDSFERSRLGITDPGEVAGVTLAAGQRTTSGTYDLRARGTTAGLRGLRITDPTTGTAYSVDWRSGGGRDAGSDYALHPGMNNPGVTVEQIADDGLSEAVLGHRDPDPAEKQPRFGLVAGQAFTVGGVTLIVESIGDKADPDATTRIGVTLTDPSVAPDTAITSGPAEGATSTSSSVAFAFTGTPADATAGFDCRLDAGAWTSCTTPTQLAGLSGGAHAFAVRARDAADHVDDTPATRSFAVDATPQGATGPTAAGGLSSPTTTVPPGASRGRGLEAAKLEVSRAQVDRVTRRLDVLAPITARASGALRGSFQAAGRTTSFSARVDAANRRVRIDQPLAAAQAARRTGILTLEYPGDADTQPQTVRLRAAAHAARLAAPRPTVADGHVRVAGTIDRRAHGVVRLQLLYEPAGQPTRTVSFSARVARGRFALDAALPAEVISGILARQGVLHSYVLYTGDERSGLRGELLSYQVLGEPKA